MLKDQHTIDMFSFLQEKWQEDAFKNNKKSSQTVSKQFVCPVTGCSRGKDSGKPFCRLSLLKTVNIGHVIVTDLVYTVHHGQKSWQVPSSLEIPCLE